MSSLPWLGMYIVGLGRLVSKIDNVMYFACLLKQASVDLVS